MNISLNAKQAEGLANFFFDIAKGLVLGGIGLSLTVPIELKIFNVFVSSVMAVAFIRMALNLLRNIK